MHQAMLSVAKTVATIKNTSPFHHGFFSAWITISDMRIPLIDKLYFKYRCLQKLRQVGVLLCMAVSAHAGSEPPIHDSLRLVGATLLKGESLGKDGFRGEFTKVPKKKLPASVAIYLKSTKTIDPLNPRV